MIYETKIDESIKWKWRWWINELWNEKWKWNKPTQQQHTLVPPLPPRSHTQHHLLNPQLQPASTQSHPNQPNPYRNRFPKPSDFLSTSSLPCSSEPQTNSHTHHNNRTHTPTLHTLEALIPWMFSHEHHPSFVLHYANRMHKFLKNKNQTPLCTADPPASLHDVLLTATDPLPRLPFALPPSPFAPTFYHPFAPISSHTIPSPHPLRSPPQPTVNQCILDTQELLTPAIA